MADAHTIVAKLKELANEKQAQPTRAELVTSGISDHAIRKYGGFKRLLDMASIVIKEKPKAITGPKILVFDIETSPIVAYVWGLFDQNIGLNQIVEDWRVLSWSAKWLGSPPEEVMYADIRDTVKDDSGVLSQIWQLLDEADIVLTQNGKRFDEKKLNARFILNGFPPPSSFRHIDTMVIARRRFSFTSTKLAYTTDNLCEEFKKLDHGKYAGFALWSECLKGNIEAWEEMKKYNMYDVLSLEEYYIKLRPWDRSINFNVYSEDLGNVCSCGKGTLYDSGYIYSNTGKFQRLTCNGCGAEYKVKGNLLPKEKRQALLS